MTLDNVTIIIPEHNRPERLQRLLNYYRGTGATILVPDSSTKEYAGTYDKATTTYRHFPGMHFLLKLRQMLPLINTDYTLYCADDDFAVPSGIQAVTQFLDANPDYVVAQGHYLTFEPRKDGSVIFEPRYIRHFESRVDGDSPVKRLQDRTGQYASFLYGVVRSDVFKRMYSYCFDASGNLRFTNLFLAEDFFCHAVRLYGKYATVPCFYSARERITGSATSTTTPKKTVLTDPVYRHEYEGYISALAEALLDCQPGLSPDLAKQIIIEADSAPLDAPSIQFKRRIQTFCHKHALLRPFVKVLDYRYAQKGLKAVKGMESYPCKTLTPEIQEILKAISQTPIV